MFHFFSFLANFASDYASLAETSAYNLVDETSTLAPVASKTATFLPSVKPDLDNQFGQNTNEGVMKRPKPLLEDALSSYTADDAALPVVTAAPVTNANTGGNHLLRGRCKTNSGK